MIPFSSGAILAGAGAAVSVAAIGVLVWRAATAEPPVPPERPALHAPQAPASVQPAPVTPQIPSFDVVRVEPSGETVVAGRAAPGAVVTLMASGKPAGTATADANGQFVIIPDPLKPGAHDLSLIQKSPAGEQESAQSVAVGVPDKGRGEALVALAEPGRATQVLSAAPPAAGAPAVLAIRSAEAQQGGGFFATGQAVPGAKLRIYLNEAHVADVTADSAGQWSLRVSRGLSPGQYAVRADQIDPASGKVAARAEAPFAYAPEVVAAATAAVAPPASAAIAADSAPSAAAPAPEKSAVVAAPANVTVAQIATASVVRGDSLWRISRKMLGQGVRYTQIYDANTAQIRDPARIYPGQILVVPAEKSADKAGR